MCSKHQESVGKSGAVNISSGLFLDQCFQSPSEGPISWFIHNKTVRHVAGDVRVMQDSSRVLRLKEAVWDHRPSTAAHQTSVHPPTLQFLKMLKRNHHFIYLCHQLPVVSSVKRPQEGICLFKNSPSEDDSAAGDLRHHVIKSKPAGCDFSWR